MFHEIENGNFPVQKQRARPFNNLSWLSAVVKNKSNQEFQLKLIYPIDSFVGAVRNIVCGSPKIMANTWCVARFGTICKILKKWKTSMEECQF